MSVKAGELGELFTQSESTLGGSGTGSVYKLPTVNFSFEPQFTTRQNRVGFIRQPISQSVGPVFYKGRIEIELNLINALRLLLRTMFDNHSLQIVTATEYGYRFPRFANHSASGAKLFAHYGGGPFLQFDGVVLDSFRVTMRQGAIVRCSLGWLALSMTESASDPVLTTTDETRGIAQTENVAIKLNTVTMSQLLEASVQFRNQANPGGFNDTGAPTRYARGPFDVTGSLVEYFDDAHAIPTKVRALTEVALDFTATSQSSSDEYLQVKVPRALFESGSPSPILRGDVSDTLGFRGLENSALAATQSEILFSIL